MVIIIFVPLLVDTLLVRGRVKLAIPGWQTFLGDPGVSPS